MGTPNKITGTTIMPDVCRGGQSGKTGSFKCVGKSYKTSTTQLPRTGQRKIKTYSLEPHVNRHNWSPFFNIMAALTYKTYERIREAPGVGEGRNFW